MLVQHFAALELAEGARIFLPLCGKTRDIAWLLSKGYKVAGAELSEIAIQELFAELGIAPQVSRHGELVLYSAANIDIWVGDIFYLSAEQLGPVDAIYDRAALVALPAGMRARYSSQLINISGIATQLLITYEYDQQLMAGPPFSVCAEEVRQHYSASYQLHPQARDEYAGGLKDVSAVETVWVLRQKGI